MHNFGPPWVCAGFCHSVISENCAQALLKEIYYICAQQIKMANLSLQSQPIAGCMIARPHGSIADISHRGSQT